MQVVPRSAEGTLASASGDTCAVMHQHVFGGAPAAVAHWLSCPQRGQRRVSTVDVGMLGAGRGRAWSGVGASVRIHPNEKGTPKGAIAALKLDLALS